MTDEERGEAGGSIAERVETLEEQVAWVIDYLSPRPAGPWMWDQLRGQARADLWGELEKFVSWLQRRYLSSLSVEKFPLPERWFESPIIVELLTALMIAHRAAYSPSEVTPSFTLVEWHERCLWPTLARIRELDLTKNNELVKKNRVAVTDENQFRTYLEQDAAQHPDAPDPEDQS